MNIKVRRAQKQRKVVVLIVVTIVLLAGAGYIVFGRGSGDKTELPSVNSSRKTTDTATKPEATTVIKLAAMGDMLAHDSVVANAWTASGYDFTPYFATIRPIYQDADIVFCNQEGLSSGAEFGITGYPAFNAPTEFADGLSRGAGCNLIGLANNHLGDKSTAAISATLDQWDRLKPLAVAGANRNADEQNTLRTFEVKGVKFAFLAFADFNNNKSTPTTSVNLYHNSLFETQLAQARSRADIVIVSMHWGTEGSTTPNADQLQQVEKLRKAGVDLVIGTGPHVLQKVEMLNRDDGGQMLVWYSIGNMLSSQLNINELTGCIAQLEIVREGDQKPVIKNPTCTPTLMAYDWTAAEKQNSDLLKRHNLTLQPLKDAGADFARLHFTETVDSRLEFVRSTLGDAVQVTP
jgi:poly-gamma-glutamate synthesis protein (capsule biosynthesis protein)